MIVCKTVQYPKEFIIWMVLLTKELFSKYLFGSHLVRIQVSRKVRLPVLKKNFFFGQCCKAYEILVPWPGIKLRLPSLEVWSVNHWTPREVPKTLSLTGPPSHSLPLTSKCHWMWLFQSGSHWSCSFFFKLFFIWWKIALQIFVGFCHKIMWISHNYIYPSPPPSPLVHHNVPGWALWVI